MPNHLWAVYIRRKDGKLAEIVSAPKNWFLQDWTGLFLSKNQSEDFAKQLAYQYGVPARLIQPDGTSVLVQNSYSQNTKV